MVYLTTAEYLVRYGNAETIRITDETRSNEVDSGKLLAALSDATDIVDAYLGKRYFVPLATPPSIVKHATGALAREILHTSRPTDAVTGEADRARKQLEGIAKGLLSLPLPENATAPGLTGSSISATSGDGSEPVFTDTKLAAFGSLGGYPGGAWRN